MLFRQAIFLSVFPFALFSQTGVISTVAGTGQPGFSGDDGPAVQAQLGLARLVNECDPARLEEQSHISVDLQGNIYLADSSNNRIRRITAAGVISTLAGTGERPAVDGRCSPLGGNAAVGEGGQARAARLYGPGQAIAMPNGNLLICDQKNNRIRQVSATGTITTIVGTSLHAFFAPNIPATSTPLDWPSSIAVGRDGLLYFAEIHSHRIARVSASGVIQTVAGDGFPGNGADNVAATASRLVNPTFLLFDTAGNLYVADQGNHKVRRITPQGIVTTFAGTGSPGFSGDGGRATAAQLNQVNGLAFDARGNLYIADMGNHRVRLVAPDGTITTVAGNGQIGRGGEGVPATQSALNFPSSVAVAPNGDLLINDWQNYQIRRVSFAARPAISTGGVVNGASFVPTPVPLAPGSIISIFGVNFSANLLQAASVPLPTELGGVRVSVSGKNIPLIFVSPNQINAQLPYDVATGQAAISVTTANGTSSEEMAPIGQASPGIFVTSDGRAIAQNQDGSLNQPGSGEARGRVLIVYLTGQGLLDGPIEAGQAAPLDRLLRATSDATANIGGQSASVLFLGLTPGFVGLSQANIAVPDGAPVGDGVEMFVSVNRQRSNTAKVSVR